MTGFLMPVTSSDSSSGRISCLPAPPMNSTKYLRRMSVRRFVITSGGSGIMPVSGCGAATTKWKHRRLTARGNLLSSRNMIISNYMNILFRKLSKRKTLRPFTGRLRRLPAEISTIRGMKTGAIRTIGMSGMEISRLRNTVNSISAFFQSSVSSHFPA